MNDPLIVQKFGVSLMGLVQKQEYNKRNNQKNKYIQRLGGYKELWI